MGRIANHPRYGRFVGPRDRIRQGEEDTHWMAGSETSGLRRRTLYWHDYLLYGAGFDSLCEHISPIQVHGFFDCRLGVCGVALLAIRDRQPDKCFVAMWLKLRRFAK